MNRTEHGRRTTDEGIALMEASAPPAAVRVADRVTRAISRKPRTANVDWSCKHSPPCTNRAAHAKKLQRHAGKVSALEVRAKMQQALAASELVTAALVDALVVVEGNSAAALVEAVKALRTIANDPNPTDETSYHVGIARSALKRIGAAR